MKMTRQFMHLFLVAIMGLWLSSCSSPTPKLNPLSPDDVIVAFGDSLTYGTGAPKETSYPVILEKIIGIKVVNEGIPGEETAGSLMRIDSVLEKYHPSLVIVCVGGNDHLRKRKPEQIKENLKNIIQHIRNTGADVLLIAPPVFSLSLSVPDLYAELGEEFGIPVDDTTLAILLKQPDLKSDYIHLNAAGYKALAESIASMLKKTGAVDTIND